MIPEDELGWIETENKGGLPMSLYRNRFQRGEVMHYFIASLVPIDDGYEGIAQITLIGPRGMLEGPPSAFLYSDFDSAVDIIEKEFERQKDTFEGQEPNI